MSLKGSVFDPQLDAVTMQLCSLLRAGCRLRKQADGTAVIVYVEGDERPVSARAVELLIEQKILSEKLALTRKAQTWLGISGRPRKFFELDDLTEGETVRVYRTGAACPLYLCDLPFSGDLEKNYPSTFTLDLYLTGTVLEQHNATVRAVVTHEGREMGVDWIGRYWVRREGEPAPGWGW